MWRETLHKYCHYFYLSSFILDVQVPFYPFLSILRTTFGHSFRSGLLARNIGSFPSSENTLKPHIFLINVLASYKLFFFLVLYFGEGGVVSFGLFHFHVFDRKYLCWVLSTFFLVFVFRLTMTCLSMYFFGFTSLQGLRICTVTLHYMHDYF